MEGGHPIAMESMQMGDAYGATAYQSGGPLAPTGAMSGFGGEQQQARPGPPQHIAPPAPPPPMGGPSPMSSGTPSGQDGQRRTLAGFLVSYQDDAQGKFWPLWQGKNEIGRAETSANVDIQIAHGTTSTRHASIECDGKRFVLSDTGSTNGTFHNEESIGFQGRRELRDCDKVRFGGCSVMFVNTFGRI
jgi:hypothetical protein